MTTKTLPRAADSTSTEAAAHETLRQTLSSARVGTEGELDVQSYLDQHADLIEPLADISATARKEFGPDAALSLKVVRDPEIDDEYLALLVRLPTYGPNVLQRIRSISAAHESQLWDKRGAILVTSDFRPVQ